MERPQIKNLAEDIVSQFFGESEATEGNPDAVFKVNRKHLTNLSHMIYSVMLEIHGDGIRQGRKEASAAIGELLDLPVRVAALESRESYRSECERGDDN